MSKQLNWSDLAEMAVTLNFAELELRMLAEKETRYSLLYGSMIRGMSLSRVIIDDYVEIAPPKKKQVPFYQTLNKYPKFVRK